jgi:hypothetical protein
MPRTYTPRTVRSAITRLSCSRCTAVIRVRCDIGGPYPQHVCADLTRRPLDIVEVVE